MPIDSEAILLEQKRYEARNIKIVPLMLRLYRLDLVMQCIIKSRLTMPNKMLREVFFLDSTRLSRKFKLLVGNERVKSSNLVTNILMNKEESNVKGLNHKLHLSEETASAFLNCKNQEKEPLALIYIRALCFFNTYKKFF